MGDVVKMPQKLFKRDISEDMKRLMEQAESVEECEELILQLTVHACAATLAMHSGNRAKAEETILAVFRMATGG